MYLGAQMTIFVWVVRSRDLFSVHEGPTYVCITPDDYNLLTGLLWSDSIVVMT